MHISDLFETPIEDFNLIGDFTKKGGSYHKEQDRKILRNPAAQEQIRQKWQRSIVPFNMYFINMPKYGRFVEKSEVSEDWIDDNMPEVASQIRIRDDAVNVIFTNNLGTERAPVTAWILAHRLGHALDENEPGTSYKQVSEFQHAREFLIETIHNIFKEYGVNDFPENDRAFFRSDRYTEHQQMLMALYYKIGKMRSARSKNIRGEYEFFLELFAQYIITGKVSFNPLPQVLRYGRFGNTRLYFYKAAESPLLNELASGLQDYF